MSCVRIVLPLTVATLCACRAEVPSSRGEGSVSPFEAVRATTCDELDVRVGGRWYGLAGVGELPAARLIAAAKVVEGPEWRELFGGRITELIALAGGPQAGATFDLALRDLDTGEEVTVEGVLSTTSTVEGLDMALRAATSAMESCGFPESVRERAQTATNAYASLVRTGYFESLGDATDWRARWITREGARADLRQLEWLVRNHFAYADADDVDDDAVIDAIHAALPQRIRAGDFALQLQKYLAGSIDGHAPRISGRDSENEWQRIENTLPGDAHFPFELRSTGSRVVAFDAGTRTLVDEDHPYLAAIDELPVDEWIEAGQSIITDGSPQLRFRRGVGLLADLDFLRMEMGRPLEDEAVVTLVDQVGESSDQRTVTLSSQAPDNAGRLPLEAEARLRVPDDIAYVRIIRMEDDPTYIAGLSAWIEESRGARGAIIDIRDNGGGSRVPLTTLLPHVLAPDAVPVVVNAGKFKIAPYCAECPPPAEGYLQNRFMVPLRAMPPGSPERAALEAWLPSFNPEWEPPAEGFSDWHYLIVGPAGRPAFAGKPVVVLQNDGNFSASDIFLSGFKGRDGVTLIGVPSSGGSARGQRYVLPHSGLSVNLATLASFQARNGALYDGVGIEPDIVMEPEPGFFVGRSDDVLDFAVEFIRSATEGH